MPWQSARRALGKSGNAILSAIRLDGSTESIVFDGATDRKMFDEYIKRVLAPTLKAGDILVLDNLNVHKSELLLEAVAARKAKVRFLPAYSPDLNPIEKMWSKVKQALRSMKARTNEELFVAIGKALKTVTAEDAQGWFKSCGYVSCQPGFPRHITMNIKKAMFHKDFWQFRCLVMC